MGLGIRSRPPESTRLRDTPSLHQIEESANFDFNEPVFCPWQSDLITSKSDVVIVEKGRQIGFSHTFGFKALFTTLTEDRDFIYTSYNLQAAKEFIKDCVRWSRVFNIVFKTYELPLIDENNFCVFEIKLYNARSIYAVAGDAKNFRGKPGADILIDEAAYRATSLEDILAAAMATLIHGGHVYIGSTHCGIDNEFNQLCESVKKGELQYEHHKVTFRDAIKQGLFKRICIKQNKEYSLNAEEEFIDKIYSKYGLRASEELDGEPGDFSSEGKIFSGLKVFLGTFQHSYEWVYFRYHDLAASDDKKDDAYYSASVKVGLHLPTKVIVIVDYTAERLSALEGDNKIIELAKLDGQDTHQLIEQEPGSSGIKYVEIMKDRLVKLGLYNVAGYAPKLAKVIRAIPAANAALNGELMIIESYWKEDFNKLIKRFCNRPQVLVNDVVDCISGSYDYIKNSWGYI